MNLDERARNVWAEVQQQVSAVERPAPAAIIRRSRRGRVASGLAAVTVLVLVGVGTAIALQDEGTAPARVTEEPGTTTTTVTSLPDDAWSPERIRAEGEPVGVLGRASGPSPAGLEVQVYCVGEATPLVSPCDTYRPYDPAEEQYRALEVTQGGRTALFDVLGPPAVMDFDEDTLLVQDNTVEATRYRLLRADGTAVELRELNTAAPAVPGPDVRLLEAIDDFRSGQVGDDGDHPYLIDEGAGTIQPLDVTDEVAWWGPNVDEALWGGAGCDVFWQRSDRSFDRHEIDCADPEEAMLDPGWNWPGLEDWLEPGRLVAIEWGGDGGPQVVHASLDGGATWTSLAIQDRPWGNAVGTMEAAIEQALATLD